MEHIFICYSRKDQDLAFKLKESLDKAGKEVWIDLEDLPASSIWRTEIQNAITESIAFIYLASANSVASEYCNKEFEFAKQLNKRIFPILLLGTTEKNIPEHISFYQWLKWSDFGKDLDLNRLIKDIDTDFSWVKFITDLGVKASRWEKQKDASRLLQGEELQETEQQLANTKTKDPQPTDLQRQYVLTSRRNEEHQSKIRNLISTGVAVVMLALAVFGFYQAQQARIKAQLERAQRQKVVFKSVSLQVESFDQQNIQIELTDLLGIEAIRYEYDPSLLDTLRKDSELLVKPSYRIGLDSELTEVVISKDGNLVATGQKNGIFCLWDSNFWKVIFCSQSDVSTTSKVSAAIENLVFNNTGSLLAVGSDNGNIQVWDTYTGKEISSMFHDPSLGQCNSAFIEGLRFLPDNQRLVSVSVDGTARLWNATNGTELARINHKASVWSLAVSEDGKYIATGDIQGNIIIWSPETGEVIHSMKHIGVNDREGIHDLAFREDNQIVASASEDGTVIMWSVNSGTQLLTLRHEGQIKIVRFNEDGKWIATAGWDNKVRVWNSTTGEMYKEFLQEDDVVHIGFIPDSEWMFSSGADKTVRIWNLDTGIELFRMLLSGKATGTIYNFKNNEIIATTEDGNLYIFNLKSHISSASSFQLPSQITDIQFDSKGKFFAIANITGDIYIGEMETVSIVRILKQEGEIGRIAFSPDGQSLISSSRDKSARVWDLNTGGLISEASFSDWCFPVAFSPKGDRVAAGARDGQVKVWNTYSGKIINSFYLSENIPMLLNFLPNSKSLIVVYLDGTIVTWDIDSGKEIARFSLHDTNILAMAMSPDGSLLAASGNSKVIKVFNTSNGKEISQFNIIPISYVSFSPDSKKIISGGEDNVARIWNINTRTEISHIDSYVTSDLNFSSDGNLVTSGGINNTAIVWDANTGLEVSRIYHKDQITYAEFSPNNEWVISGDKSGYVLVWQWNQHKIISLLCERLTRNLSLSEWNQYFLGEPYHQTCPQWPVGE